MNKDENIRNICDRIISKLEVELNSSVSTLVKVSDLEKKVAHHLESKDDEKDIFEILYPLIYLSAVNNLSSDIASDDSFTESSVNSLINKKTLNPLPLSSHNNEAVPLKNYMDDNTLHQIESNSCSSSSAYNGESLENNIITSSSEFYVHEEGIASISHIICSLLPHVDKLEIEQKLKENHHSNYKIILLQEYIASSLENGFDVSDLVFSKLDEWIKDSKVKENSQKVKKKSKMKTKSPQKFDSVGYKNGENLENELKVKKIEESNPLCMNGNKEVITNDSQVSSFLSQSSIGEKVNFLLEVFPGLNKDKVTKELSRCSTIDEIQIIISNYLDGSAFINEKEHQDMNESSADGIYEANSQNKMPSRIDNEEGCVIIDVVKSNKPPPLIELDKESSCSPESEVFVVEETMPEFKLEDFANEQALSQDSFENSTGDNHLNGEILDKNDPKEDNLILENIDNDDIPWREAESICRFLPHFQLNNVHQSIMDNYYHPQRKVKVLTEYMELALEDGQEVNPEVFEALSYWQASTSRKRSSSTELEKAHGIKKKRHKQMDDQYYLSIPQPSTSTSKDMMDIPMEQPLPPATILPNNTEFDVQTIFQSLPEEAKSWYLKKVDFLSEIVSNFTKEYLLSQIIHCQTEADVMQVTTRLLEEQTLNILQPNSIEEEEILPETQESGPVVQATNQLDINEASPSTSTKDDASTNQLSAAEIEDRIQAHIQQLGEMFSDADPDFISERATEVAGNHEKFVELVVELTENRTYPKMEEYLKRQKKMNMRKKFIEGMSVEEFMEYFEDPEKVFCDTAKEMNKLYMRNAKAQLMKDLPFHLSKRIDSVFKANNHHYLPSLRILRKEKGARKTKRTVGGKQPGDLDDIFIKELCYAKMEEKIKEHNLKKEKNRQLAFQIAKDEGSLLECQCCFDDEVLKIDMSSCGNLESSHYFCNNCIKRYAEEQIGQGKQEFVCLEGECKSTFSLGTLKKVLKPSIFSNLLKRKQAEEIAAAGIQDLESCPFCNFATIMPNKEDRVFKCLNPECLKDSCRLCKELNHIPLRCEEVEKKKQTDARTFLENEMTEAMIRECYKCKKRFIKEEGCNKMVCSCGAMMCYLCKKPIKGYDHFASDSRTTVKTSQDKCPLWSNSLQLHAEEVQKRAAEAKQKLDPNVDLLHDPTKDMPQVPDYLKKPKPNPQGNREPLFGGGNNNDNDNNRILAHMEHVRNLRNRLENNAREVMNFPRVMADILMAENQHMIHRHTHQHRHHHFYFTVNNNNNNNNPPPNQIPLPPPPPAHQPPPPPPAHQLPPPPTQQQQQRPPFAGPFLDDHQQQRHHHHAFPYRIHRLNHNSNNNNNNNNNAGFDHPRLPIVPPPPQQGRVFGQNSHHHHHHHHAPPGRSYAPPPQPLFIHPAAAAAAAAAASQARPPHLEVNYLHHHNHHPENNNPNQRFGYDHNLVRNNNNINHGNNNNNNNGNGNGDHPRYHDQIGKNRNFKF